MNRWPIALVACAIACSSKGGDTAGPLPADVQAVLDFGGHAVVVSQKTFGDYRNVVATARSFDEEIVAAQPMNLYEVIVINGDQRASVALKGVPPEATGDAAVMDYAKYLVAGRAVGPSQGDDEPLEVVMGSDLGRQLHARIGDTLTIVMPILDPADTKAPRSTKARVVGVMYVPMIEYRDRMLITSLRGIQRFGDVGDVVMGVELRLRHREQAPRVAQALEKKLGPPYEVMDWCELHKSLWRAMGRSCP